MDPDMAHGTSMDWDIYVDSSGNIGHFHQYAPHPTTTPMAVWPMDINMVSGGNPGQGHSYSLLW